MHVYAPMNIKYITVRKNSLPNEFFHEFSIKFIKKETYGLKHLAEEC